MKPNVVFIVIDDLGWMDLSCYGSDFYETPRIDQLARSGAMFSNGYAPCPVCSPSRAALLTGKYCAHVGVTDWIPANSKGRLLSAPYYHYLPLEEYNLARLLGDKGYRCLHVGKWHLGEEKYYPGNQGFEVNIGGSHYGHPHNGYYPPYNLPNMPEGEEGEYLTDKITDYAVEYITNHDYKKPLFLNLWHFAAHVPIQAPKELVEKYRKKAQALGLDKIDPFEEGEYFPVSHKQHMKVKRRKLQSDAVYAAMIENLDTNVGRVLDAIEAVGQKDNTIVVFVSDNGGLSSAEGSPTCNAPLREGKGWSYEGGVRINFIVRHPDHREGLVSKEVVNLVDLYPTLMTLCGITDCKGQDYDGTDITPAIFGFNLPQRPVFWHYPHYSNQGGSPYSAVRYGCYKLIESYETERLELYDIEADLSEEQDLSAKLPDITQSLHTILKDWKHKVNARIPQVNPEYPEN